MTAPGVALAPPLYRHPLGLPAGSVRSTLVLMIVGLFWLILLLPGENVPPVPLFLYLLLALVLVFFAAHGKSIAAPGVDHRSPWWLPRGVFRGFIVLGTVAVIAWQAYQNPDLLTSRLQLSERQHLERWPRLLLALSGGYALGWLIHLGPWREYPWFQDIQAWLSLVAMAILFILAVVHLLINPDVGKQIDLPTLECIVVAIVAFYFGVRS
jgi:hypothetical protein